MSIAATIFARLQGSTAITNLVGANVFPEFRAQIIPSIVYDPKIIGQGETYTTTGPNFYELTVSAVASNYDDACALADAIKPWLDNQSWSDSFNNVHGCWLKDRNEGEVPIVGQIVRADVIDLIFDLTVVALT